MKTLITIILLNILSLTVFSQASRMFDLNIELQYDGGYEEYNDFIKKNVNYPYRANEEQIQGIVLVGFVLTKEGVISQISIKNPVGCGCDEEAIRILKLLKGKLKALTEVDQYFEFKLKFKLMEAENINVLIEKGNLLYAKANFEDAIPIYNEIIRRAPYQTDILLKRGVCNMKNNNLRAACVDWSRAKELNDNGADVYLTAECKK